MKDIRGGAIRPLATYTSFDCARHSTHAMNLVNVRGDGRLATRLPCFLHGASASCSAVAIVSRICRGGLSIYSPNESLQEAMNWRFAWLRFIVIIGCV